MYKKLTQIHLNYKFKKITFKNFQIHGLSDCLAKGVKILDGMKCSPLLAPIPLDTWKFEMQLSFGDLSMSYRSIICRSRTDKSRYFAEPRPIIVN